MPVASSRHQLSHTEPCRASLHTSPQRMLEAYAEFSRLPEAMTPVPYGTLNVLAFHP
jgi:hypothetical protein